MNRDLCSVVLSDDTSEATGVESQIMATNSSSFTQLISKVNLKFATKHLKWILYSTGTSEVIQKKFRGYFEALFGLPLFNSSDEESSDPQDNVHHIVILMLPMGRALQSNDDILNGLPSHVSDSPNTSLLQISYLTQQQLILPDAREMIRQTISLEYIPICMTMAENEAENDLSPAAVAQLDRFFPADLLANHSVGMKALVNEVDALVYQHYMVQEDEGMAADGGRQRLLETMQADLQGRLQALNEISHDSATFPPSYEHYTHLANLVAMLQEVKQGLLQQLQARLEQGIQDWLNVIDLPTTVNNTTAVSSSAPAMMMAKEYQRQRDEEQLLVQVHHLQLQMTNLLFSKDLVPITDEATAATGESFVAHDLYHLASGRHELGRYPRVIHRIQAMLQGAQGGHQEEGQVEEGGSGHTSSCNWKEVAVQRLQELVSLHYLFRPNAAVTIPIMGSSSSSATATTLQQQQQQQGQDKKKQLWSTILQQVIAAMLVAFDQRQYSPRVIQVIAEDSTQQLALLQTLEEQEEAPSYRYRRIYLEELVKEEAKLQVELVQQLTDKIQGYEARNIHAPSPVLSSSLPPSTHSSAGSKNHLGWTVLEDDMIIILKNSNIEAGPILACLNNMCSEEQGAAEDRQREEGEENQQPTSPRPLLASPAKVDKRYGELAKSGLLQERLKDTAIKRLISKGFCFYQQQRQQLTTSHSGSSSSSSQQQQQPAEAAALAEVLAGIQFYYTLAGHREELKEILHAAHVKLQEHHTAFFTRYPAAAAPGIEATLARWLEGQVEKQQTLATAGAEEILAEAAKDEGKATGRRGRTATAAATSTRSASVSSTRARTSSARPHYDPLQGHSQDSLTRGAAAAEVGYQLGEDEGDEDNFSALAAGIAAAASGEEGGGMEEMEEDEGGEAGYFTPEEEEVETKHTPPTTTVKGKRRRKRKKAASTGSMLVTPPTITGRAAPGSLGMAKKKRGRQPSVLPTSTSSSVAAAVRRFNAAEEDEINEEESEEEQEKTEMVYIRNTKAPQRAPLYTLVTEEMEDETGNTTKHQRLVYADEDAAPVAANQGSSSSSSKKPANQQYSKKDLQATKRRLLQTIASAVPSKNLRHTAAAQMRTCLKTLVEQVNYLPILTQLPGYNYPHRMSTIEVFVEVICLDGYHLDATEEQLLRLLKAVFDMFQSKNLAAYVDNDLDSLKITMSRTIGQYIS